MSTDAYDMWAIRRAVSVSRWDDYAELIAKERTKHQPMGFPPDMTWRHLLEPLKTDGFVMLPMTIGDPQHLREWFEPFKPGDGPHIYSGPNPYFRCYPSAYVLRSPLLMVMNQPALLGLIELYMGCWPTLYSMNVWWSDPAPNNEPQIDHMQRFHRDRDDWRFLTLFVYLTDVTEDNGPHQMIRRSHLEDTIGAGKAFDEDCERQFADRIQTVTGPAGTAFLVNTIALHRGLPPRTKPRLIAWGRYGFGPNINSFDLEAGPIAARVIPNKPVSTIKSRYINRLLLNYDEGPWFE